MSSSSDTPAQPEVAVTRPITANHNVTAWALPELDELVEPHEVESEAVTVEKPNEADFLEERRAAAQNGYAEGQALGRKEGFDAGYAEGMAAAREESERLERRLQGWLHALTEPLADLDKEVGTQLARLATQIARAMIYRELTIAPEQIEAVAREALEALPTAVRQVVLICHPDDRAALESVVQAGELAQARGQSFEIRTDETIQPGGLWVASADSEIQAAVDARLEGRWASLSLRLLGQVVSGPGDPIPSDGGSTDGMPKAENPPDATVEPPSGGDDE